MGDSRYVSVFVDEVVRESDSGLALLLSIDGGEYWIPRSQIREPEVLSVGDSAEVEITKWIADDKEIDY